MKHKTSELSGALLDAAVAKADGWNPSPTTSEIYLPPKGVRVQGPRHIGFDGPHGFSPSDHWEHGGPIIEREGINPFSYIYGGERYWAANMEGQYPSSEHGSKSCLEACMRAYVASKLGDEVEL